MIIQSYGFRPTRICLEDLIDEMGYWHHREKVSYKTNRFFGFRQYDMEKIGFNLDVRTRR